jgi:hypothetical protein
VPNILTKKDQQKQIRMLRRSKHMYKQGKYYTRKRLTSYPHKTSDHILRARKIYNIQNISPTPELAKKTGCSLQALKKIVNKGEGAYFSSGSRPNQTAQSWGLARLASVITAGKAAAVDYTILEKGCDHKKPAFRMATRARKQYHHGQSKTRKKQYKN